MSIPITKERWLEAQISERSLQNDEFDDKFVKHSRTAYLKYVGYTGLTNGFDMVGRSIVEIGPSKVPGLYFCTNISHSYMIEPLVFEDSAKALSSRKDLSFIRDPAETCEFPKADEAWLFNVLQHVIDPIKIIERCKENVKVIRFFEPIDTGCDLAHPHTFNFDFFARHFGQDNVKYFIGGSGGQGFHGNNCAYGVYHA